MKTAKERFVTFFIVVSAMFWLFCFFMFVFFKWFGLIPIVPAAFAWSRSLDWGESKWLSKEREL